MLVDMPPQRQIKRHLILWKRKNQNNRYVKSIGLALAWGMDFDRILFVAHREEILKQAQQFYETYKDNEFVSPLVTQISWAKKACRR